MIDDNEMERFSFDAPVKNVFPAEMKKLAAHRHAEDLTLLRCDIHDEAPRRVRAVETAHEHWEIHGSACCDPFIDRLVSPRDIEL